MTLAKFVEYIKVHLTWKNKPDQSTPILGEHMMTIESGIKANNEAIQELAAAVVSQITNDPNKIASMAALYSVNKKADDLISDLANKLDSSAIIAQYNKLQIGNVKIQYGKMECIVNFNGQASIVFPEGYSQENLYHCMAVPMSGSYAVRSITNSGNNNSLALLLDGNDQKPEYQSKIWMQYIVIGT